MNRIISTVAVLAVVALTAGGCATFQADVQALTTGISLATKSITNPVTKTDEAKVELVIGAAISVLKGYKKACIQGTADKNCKANIVAIQAYTRQMDPLLTQLRNFVDNNDKVNAIVAYQQLSSLYANFKKAAGDLGYNVGNLP